MHVKYLKDIRSKSFQIFEAPNLMWPQAHQFSLKKVLIYTLLKFDVQRFRYTLYTTTIICRCGAVELHTKSLMLMMLDIIIK